MNVVDRFLRYVAIDTQSDENVDKTPSTDKQMAFARSLEQELIDLGLEEVSLDENGYLMATLPATTDKPCATIGFIAHMDTSPDMSGANVKPRRITQYDGSTIVLNQEQNVYMSPKDFPELLHYQGQDLLVTDGTTLLGADDKAGIAEIITAIDYLIQHPEIPHGKVRIGFTPDEEIGRGAHKFDVQKFACDWAYTMDGGEIGELEYENFNAAAVNVFFKGKNIHPGYAKNKMINAMQVAMQFNDLLPKEQRPEHTEGYEGFYHLVQMSGAVEEAQLTYIVRDHDKALFEAKLSTLQNLVSFLDLSYPSCIRMEVKQQYKNMKEIIEPKLFIINLAAQAMQEVGVEPKIKPIRGGTDGSQLSFMGLPCPNIFAGGHNFHGRYEYIPIPSMEKAVEVIVKIVELNAR